MDVNVPGSIAGIVTVKVAETGYDSPQCRPINR